MTTTDDLNKSADRQSVYELQVDSQGRVIVCKDETSVQGAEVIAFQDDCNPLPDELVESIRRNVDGKKPIKLVVIAQGSTEVYDYSYQPGMAYCHKIVVP